MVVTNGFLIVFKVFTERKICWYSKSGQESTSPRTDSTYSFSAEWHSIKQPPFWYFSTHRLVQLSIHIRDFSLSSAWWLTQKLTTGQDTSLRGGRMLSHQWDICITLWRLRDHLVRRGRKLEDRNSTVASGHGRTVALMNSQQLWSLAQDHTSLNILAWSLKWIRSLYPELRALDGFWERKSQSSLCMGLLVGHPFSIEWPHF